MWASLAILLQPIPQPYLTIIKNNYAATISSRGTTHEYLSRYFDGCFNDIGRIVGLYKTWICVNCLSRNSIILDVSFGYGQKPKKCGSCGKPTYEVATFQARASYIGTVFEYACQYLLLNKFHIDSKATGESTRLYDLEIRPNAVIEAKGSPDSMLNPDGSKSKLQRAGLLRSDTEKKAFANASKWRRLFPAGYFFIITNALPAKLLSYRNDKVTAIYDVTNEKQLNQFVEELRVILGK